jgi:low temperature requirement protein LtrA
VSTQAGDQATRARQLLRDRSGAQRVTNIELFFDLVYVAAVAAADRRPGLTRGRAGADGEGERLSGHA